MGKSLMHVGCLTRIFPQSEQHWIVFDINAELLKVPDTRYVFSGPHMDKDMNSVRFQWRHFNMF